MAFYRSTIVGAAFGLAATIIDRAFGALRTIDLRMPATPLGATEAALLEVGLGVVLGVVAAPLARGRFGGAVVLLTIAAAWTGLAYVVAPDPQVVAMWASAPIGGLVLVTVGALLARRWPRLPWLAGALALAATIVVPVAVDELRTRNEVPPPPLGAARPGAPDVMVVVLDTVRAANMSAYGYGRPTTPTVERVAAEGALFLDATSPSTWSLPSHGSLFTGWFPSAHRTDGDHRHLDATPPTLADVFTRAGYDTRCFTANPHISDSFGLTRGFRWSDRAYLGGSGGRSFQFIYRILDLIGVSATDKGGGEVAGHVEAWLATRPAEGPPAFTFINFLEAHFPYHQVPDEFLAKFTTRSRRELRRISLEAFGAQFGRTLTPAEVAAARPPSIDMYDAGILYSDHLLARVVDALRRSGRLDRTILVVLADHGELIGEHDLFGHGVGLYEPGVRVPLLLRYPPAVPAGTRVAIPVSTVGVFATALDLAGLEPPVPVHVGSLMAAVKGGAAGEPIIVERSGTTTAHPGATAALGQSDRRYRIYRSGTLKLAETSKGDAFLYDLAADPGETQNVALARPAELARMRAELAGWVAKLGLPPVDAAGGSQPAPEIDEATRERLKALGYAQ